VRLGRLAIVVAALAAICAVSLAGLYVWLTFGEVREHRYATFAEARAARDASWLPPWLPSSAVLIHEWHDLDTNRAFGSFRFDGEGRQAMQAVLEPSTDAIVQIDPDPSFSVNLPFLATREELEQASFDLYRSDAYGVAVRWTDGVAYYWTVTP